MQESQKLWGGETEKAVDNFPVSGDPVKLEVIHWLGRIKAAAARVNGELGLLDADVAERIAQAADRVASGEFDDQFPVDAFQTGSGTSSNTNANEVIANLAGEGVHPNDHVNMGQSSNDVFPSAVHLAALDEATNRLLPALERLEKAFADKAEEFKDIVKAGRTHLMDAVPVTLGQEFAGYAAQIRLGARRIRNALPQVAQIPLGGTATGTGLNTHPEFAERVRKLLAEQSGLDIRPPEDPFEAQGNRDALVELSGALKVLAVSVTKIANDLAMMGSGPRAGIGELLLPELQKGSSIMPGKVNPVIPEVVIQVAAQVIGNDTAITVAGSQGNFELNVRVPLIARNLLESIQLLTAKSLLFAEKCVEGIEANEEGCRRSAELTLAVATALNPYIGYDKGTEIVNAAAASGRTLREVAIEHGVDEATLDKALDLRRIAAGSSDSGLIETSRCNVSFSRPGGGNDSQHQPDRAGARARRPRLRDVCHACTVEDERFVHQARGLCRSRHAGPVQQGGRAEDRLAARQERARPQPRNLGERGLLRAAREDHRHGRAGLAGLGRGAPGEPARGPLAARPGQDEADHGEAGLRLLPRLSRRLEHQPPLPEASRTRTWPTRSSGACTRRSRTSPAWSRPPAGAGATSSWAATRWADRSRAPTPPGTSTGGPGPRTSRASCSSTAAAARPR